MGVWVFTFYSFNTILNDFIDTHWHLKKWNTVYILTYLSILKPKMFLTFSTYLQIFFFSEEVITIVSMLYGEQSILLNPQAKRDEALVARKKFVSSEGDLITYLNIYRAFNQSKNKVKLL